MTAFKALLLFTFLLAPAFAQATESLPMSTAAHEASVGDWWRERCYRRCDEDQLRCFHKGRPKTYCKWRLKACIHDCNH